MGTTPSRCRRQHHPGQRLRLRRHGSNPRQNLPTPLLAALAALAAALTGLAIAVAGHVNGGGLSLLVVPLHVERARFAVVKNLVAVGVDAGEVDEDILGPVLGADEAEPLLGVKELNGTALSHCGNV